MAQYIRRGLPSWRGSFSAIIPARTSYRGKAPPRLVGLLRPCSHFASDTTTAIPAGTAAPAGGTVAPMARPSSLSSYISDAGFADIGTAGVAVQVKTLEEDILRALCEPRPSNPLLVAIVRGLVQLGELPSREVVRALVDHFTATRDAQSSTAVLSLLKRVKPPASVTNDVPLPVDTAEGLGDDPVGMMYACLVNALCRRRDVTGALEAVADMERDTGRPATAKVFLSLLKACAGSKPPMLREAEAVWHQVEERGLTTSTEAGSVRQELFVTRTMVYANSAGFPHLCRHDTSGEDSQQQVLQQKVDGAWNDMLSALSASASPKAGDACREGKKQSAAVTAESWIVRAAAMSLCSRGRESGSDSAASRSLEAVDSYLGAGGNFSGKSHVAALGEVVRGLARCGRQKEVERLVSDVSNSNPPPPPSTAVTAADKARARAKATRSGLLAERLLRALGARGAGSDDDDHYASVSSAGSRRDYGMALLEAIEIIAAGARRHGRRGSEGADSRLTATLQAILSASHYLGSADCKVIDVAANRAMDAAVADAQTNAASGGLGGHVGEGWEGPGLAALSLLTLLRVCKRARGEGIAGALDVLQEMHDRGLSPPLALAGQLDAIIRRHGTNGQKRSSKLLLAGALKEAGDGENVGKNEGEVVENNAVLGKPGAGETDDVKVEDVVSKAVDNFDRKHQQKLNRLEDPSVLGSNSEDASHSAGDGRRLQMLRKHRRSRSAEASGPKPFSGVRGIEMACSTIAKRAEDRTGDIMSLYPVDGVETHQGVLRRVVALAERGRAHAALQLLHAVDGRKKGSREAVPYRVYALLFRALSNGYSVKGGEEMELAADPESALLWLLRGMARQGHEPKRPLLNFGLEAFAVAAKCGKFQEGEERARRRICKAALDFFDGMKTGWDGLHPPVQPNVISYNIVIKTICRLRMFDEAFQVLDMMERDDCKPDRVTYSTLIHGLTKAGDNDGAWEVLVAMTNKGITPHSIAIDGIVDGFVRSGEIGEAISFAQHAFNQYGCPPTPAKFCKMIIAAAGLDDGKHEARRAVIVAEQLWPHMEEDSHPVLGHPSLKELLVEQGVFEPVDRL